MLWADVIEERRRMKTWQPPKLVMMSLGPSGWREEAAGRAWIGFKERQSLHSTGKTAVASQRASLEYPKNGERWEGVCANWVLSGAVARPT